jgi:limonene 1,2-monooxygenase
MLADRIVMLDHLTRGRMMFGAGPGQLTSDAHMLGIDPMTQYGTVARCDDAFVPWRDCHRTDRLVHVQ